MIYQVIDGKLTVIGSGKGDVKPKPMAKPYEPSYKKHARTYAADIRSYISEIERSMAVTHSDARRAQLQESHDFWTARHREVMESAA